MINLLIILNGSAIERIKLGIIAAMPLVPRNATASPDGRFRRMVKKKTQKQAEIFESPCHVLQPISVHHIKPHNGPHAVLACVIESFND